MSSDAMMYMRNMMKEGTINSVYPKPGDDMTKLREMNVAQSSQRPLEPGVTIYPDTLAGVEVELLEPEHILGDTILFYIHGGGFSFGNTITSRGYGAALAGESGLRVYTISYRLTPEHPFPAGEEDCFAVYKALLTKYPDNNIALVGESGGGYYSLVVTLMAKDQGYRLPACVCAFSALTTLAEELPSRIRNSEIDCMLPADINELLRIVYVPDKNLQELYHPYISPLYGDYKGFPPLMIVVDGSEVLEDDSVLLAQKAKEAGVEVVFDSYDLTMHAFPILGRAVPESAKVLVDTVEFIKKHC